MFRIANYFVAALFSVAPVLASASDPGPAFSSIQLPEGKTYFDLVSKMYQDGTVPQMEKIIRIGWAGRCFTNGEDENEPIGTAMLLRQTEDDVGPIDGLLKKYETVSVIHKWNASYFDRLTYARIEALRAEAGFPFKSLEVLADQLEVSDETSPRIGESIRVNGRYLIQAFTDKKNGEIFAACYFFIPGYEK